METIFISGSLRIKNLHDAFKARLANAVGSGFKIIVGDADGADKSIQQFLFDEGAEDVMVYCTGSQPRSNVGKWPIHPVWSDYRPGTRNYFTAKDIEMAEAANFGLMVWDSKSTGTLSNVVELLKSKKTSVIFVNKVKKFVTVSDVEHLDILIGYMSEHARCKADDKIQFSSSIAGLKSEQYRMFG